MKWVKQIKDLSKGDFLLVGKKAANLGEIARVGLRVPDGFAVTVDAYIEFLRRNKLDEQITSICEKSANSSIEQIEKTAEVVNSLLENATIPSEIEKEICEAYELLCKKHGEEISVAVRSSGVESRPGMFETYLNVKGAKKVVNFVKKVWMSAFGARAISYRFQKKLPPLHDKLGVAIVEMVDAKAAGIAFTADPNTGDTARIFVDANWGLGESVVGGHPDWGDPDRWIIDKSSLSIITQSLGLKKKAIFTGVEGVQEVDLEQDKQNIFCLSEMEVREVANAARRLEQHFGEPVDVEWAIEKRTGECVVLQARPIVLARIDPLEYVIDMMIYNL
ncbi:MAG: PEP/pyruvate-binding domain-containing protein [Candidatus Jordarchaeales archaeon]